MDAAIQPIYANDLYLIGRQNLFVGLWRFYTGIAWATPVFSGTEDRGCHLLSAERSLGTRFALGNRRLGRLSFQLPLTGSFPMRLTKLQVASGHLETACDLDLAQAHPATVVLLAGTAEDMFRCLPATNDTPAVGEHMLQYARQMTGRPDLHYREIYEDMVGLRNAVKHAEHSDEAHVEVGRRNVHRYLIGALMNALRCGIELSEAMIETLVRITDIEDALESPSR